jgi:catechol 2,3-dioxygenase-like lactoylglutathione lyase family enzyme
MSSARVGAVSASLTYRQEIELAWSFFEYWKTGVFHFCVQDPNVEELAERIVAEGGKKRMDKPRYYFPGEKPYRMIYMEDPFGNIIEIYSHSYELTYSDGAYK